MTDYVRDGIYNLPSDLHAEFMDYVGAMAEHKLALDKLIKSFNKRLDAFSAGSKGKFYPMTPLGELRIQWMADD